MRDEEYVEFWDYNATPVERAAITGIAAEYYTDAPDHDGGIYTAANTWCRDPAAAKARYGPIASWDTSGVTSMYRLFCEKPHFNEDISRWNVSNVLNMLGMFAASSDWDDGPTAFNCDLSCWDVGQVYDMCFMFHGATSFDRKLGGWWSTSTADKTAMFDLSPGTIVGGVEGDVHE